MLGYITLDTEVYLNWYKKFGFDAFIGFWKNDIYPLSSDKCLKHAYDSYCSDANIAVLSDRNDPNYKLVFRRFQENCHRYISKIEKLSRYMDRFNQKFSLISEYTNFYFAKFGSEGYIFLKCAEGISIEYLKDYKNVDVISNSDVVEGILTDLVPAGYTLADSERQMDELKTLEASQKQRKTDIESGQCEELKKLQDELDSLTSKLNKQKEELLAKLEEEMNKLNDQKAEMMRKIEILETKIYAIRCFTGEIINFSQLRYGKSLPCESPIIIHQKVRYLDEEMGRMAAMYDFDYDDIQYFEEFISESIEAFDTFCPTDKGVSLVRISKDNAVYGSHPFYSNMLKQYEVFHGKALGILIRDGENLYCGWCDDEKISIPDNLFYTDKSDIKELEPDDEHFLKSTSKGEILSRYFLFNILQGCVSNQSRHSNLIQIPDGVKLLPPNKYVIYSSADGWVESDLYGSFSDILSMCNNNTKLGDHVVSALYLHGGGYESYSNTRGRGYKNIVHGTHVSNNKIYKINMLDHEGSRATYESGITREVENSVYDHSVGEFIKKTETEDIRFNFYFGNNSTVKDCIEYMNSRCKASSIEFDESKLHMNLMNKYYVSVLKDDSDFVYYDGNFRDRKRDSRVNFNIETDEFINIELMNSAWLEYFITTKRPQNVRLGGSNVNYSYLIMYLNTAIKHVREREEHEMALLMDAGFRDFDKIDWRDKLSRYKIETGRHILMPRWAKQLSVKWNEEISNT